jgi:hypothetical protein
MESTQFKSHESWTSSRLFQFRKSREYMRKECNRVTSSDVMNLSDLFPVSPRVRHFLAQRIHLSHFYVKRKFPWLRRKFGDQATSGAVDFRLEERSNIEIGSGVFTARSDSLRPLPGLTNSSSVSLRVMPFRKPGTSKGDRRRGDFGVMENKSSLRRRMTTSSLLDSSRDRKINCFYRKIIARFPPLKFQNPSGDVDPLNF